MRIPLHTAIFLGVLAVPLVFSGLPSYAQQALGGTSATTTAPSEPPLPPPGEERAERQKLREEGQTLRIEHEQLQSERDALKTQCMDAKGQDHADCETKYRDLRQRAADLHQRIESFKAEMQTEYPGSMQERPSHAAAGGTTAPSGNRQATPPTALPPVSAQN